MQKIVSIKFICIPFYAETLKEKEKKEEGKGDRVSWVAVEVG